MSANNDTIRYYVGDTSALEGMSREEVEDVTYDDLDGAEEAVADFLDEVYGNVTIAGMEYTTSEALKSVDPIAWRCLLADEIAEIDLNDYPSEESDEDE